MFIPSGSKIEETSFGILRWPRSFLNFLKTARTYLFHKFYSLLFPILFSLMVIRNCLEVEVTSKMKPKRRKPCLKVLHQSDGFDRRWYNFSEVFLWLHQTGKFFSIVLSRLSSSGTGDSLWVCCTVKFATKCAEMAIYSWRKINQVRWD